MAKTFYKLFGQEFMGSQAAMMAHVFSELLTRHADRIPDALQQFNCLDTTDYAQDVGALRASDSQFSNQRTFQINGQVICVGTAYNVEQKRAYISQLFRLCGEDERQFDLLEENELTSPPNPVPDTLSGGRRSREGVSYRLFGKVYHSNQAEMMYHAFEEILNRFPQFIGWATKNLKCVSRTDYTLQENRGPDMPRCFSQCRVIPVGEEWICVGSTYDHRGKMNRIDRLIQQAELPKNVFQPLQPVSETMPASQTWMEQAVYATIERLQASNWPIGPAGYITVPPGVDKLLLMEELVRQLADDGDSLPVLLLTATPDLASKYAEGLRQILGESCAVQLASSLSELISEVRRPGSITVSSIRSLLSWNNAFSTLKNPETIEFFSYSLLVIAEEAAYRNWGRICPSVRRYFPNATLLGLTIDCAPSAQLIKEFGPMIYAYSCTQALQDRAVKRGFYQQVPGVPEVLTDRTQRIADWITARENGQKTSAMLLCNDIEAALSLFFKLQTSLDAKRIRIHVPYLFRSSQQDRKLYRQLPKESRWDGTRFPGMLIVCTAIIYNLSVDTVYLAKQTDRFTTLSALSALAMFQKNGRLVDFHDHWRLLKEEERALLMEEPPSSISARDNGLLSPLRQQLADALSEHEYHKIEAILTQISAVSPEEGARISNQLAFLFPANMPPAPREEYWAQHHDLLAWKSDLWCILSQDSACIWKETNNLDTAVPEQNNPTENPEQSLALTQRPQPVPAAHIDETPQQRGARLEQAVYQLIRKLFELSDEIELKVLRRQRSGIQYGFDISFTYQDSFGVETTCVIECKDYQKRLIKTDDVSAKLSAAQDTRKPIDHWIILSPNGTATNDLNRVYQEWLAEDKWYPILDIQLWTPDNGVEELFGLFPDLYRQFYAFDPPEKSDEERGAILKAWKDKLAPVPHLPPAWRRYLHNPEWMLTYPESDLVSLQNYRKTYPNRAPSRLLDGGEQLIDGSAEEYISKWLQREDSFYALLWGDFGDGKSFFTYVLARYVAKQFLRSPDTGWIPLRLSLRMLSGNNMDGRQFLEERLKDFDANLSLWNQVKLETGYRFFIILDGLDEMSLDMSDSSVLENLSRLEHLLTQFDGCKVLVTSRKMEGHTDPVRNRVLEALHQPLVLHMAPVTLKDRLTFLERMANNPERRSRLEKIRTTHDLIGLAAKPLFLNMIEAQLDNQNIHAMDMVDIYQDYAQQALARSYEYHLEMRGDRTSPQAVRMRMLLMLEQLALCMQELGTDSISLETFKAKIGQDDLAQSLWDCAAQSSRAIAEDADHRLTGRTLLKCDNTEPEKRCFFHRSMKEFFIACGVVRALCQENVDEIRPLLSQCRLSHEILGFTGQKLRRLDGRQSESVKNQLVELAHEIRAESSKQPFFLSTNSVSLLHYGGFGLPGTDWSGLRLDEAILSGEKLSQKNFFGSSMRFAHLDNADLRDCDLRGCDFTGVQFEKSGQLTSFAVCPTEDAILAHYRDGVIRRWQISDGQSRAMATLEQTKSYQGHILSSRDGWEGLLLSDQFQFWERSTAQIMLAGYAVLRPGLRILDLGETTVLARQGSRLYLILLVDKSILYQREVSADTKACLMSDRVLILQVGKTELELLDLSDENPVSTIYPHERQISCLCASARSDTAGIILSGDEQGNVERLNVSFNQITGQWDFVPGGEISGCEKPVRNIAIDVAGRAYAAASTGAIIRYASSGAEQLGADAAYHLELKCTGALIEGVQPQEQYQTLKHAGAG